MSESGSFEVETEILRGDATRWDEIAEVVRGGVWRLECDVGLSSDWLDKVVAQTDWLSKWVAAAAEIRDFATQGYAVLHGSGEAGTAGIGEILRSMATAYEEADVEAQVTFQDAIDRANNARSGG